MAAAASLSHLHLHGKLSTRSGPRSNPWRRPSTIIIASGQSQSSNYWGVIEAHLEKSIRIRPPLSVFEPMYHLTFAAPKNRAPPLCVAACELVGGSPEDAVTAASVIHLMHAAAFTHQHLPLTDRPLEAAVHHVYHPNIELLLPDGMVPYGFELLGRSELAQTNPDRILRVIIEISGAMGSQGIVDGLYHEMLYKYNQENDEEEKKKKKKMVEYICEKKEGELHGCAAACGAILGGGSEVEIQKLRKFGVYVGMTEGMVNGVGKNEEGRFEFVKELKEKAVKELGIFDAQKLDHISSLLD